MKENSVKFFKSLKWQMDRFIIIMVCIVITATIAIATPIAGSGIDSIINSYITDLATMKGQLIEMDIDTAGGEKDSFNNDAAGLLSDCSVKGMRSSYAYLVDSNGTMIYHPKKDKIGRPVENTVIKGVVADLKAGKNVKGTTVTYDFNGVKKYAGFYVAKDKSFIVVISCDKSDVMKPLEKMAATLAIFGLITAAAAGTIAFFLMKKKLSPVDDLSDCMNSMGSLDLSESDRLVSLSERTDEFGTMGRTMMKALASLRDTVLLINEQADSLI